MRGKTTIIMRDVDAVTKCGPEKGHWVDVRMNQEAETVMN